LISNVIDPLVAVRALHFMSTMLIAGAAAFSLFVADPIWQARDVLQGASLKRFRMQLAPIIWASLGLAVASGVAHLVLVAADITGGSSTEVIANGTAWSVVTDTNFGHVSQLRLVLAAALAALLVFGRRQSQPGSPLRVLAAAVAGLLLGSLAFTGHASGASGEGAIVHLISDALHALAAGVWLGGLIPLSVLITVVTRSGEQVVEQCGQVLRRFSNLGAVSVATLFASGVINTWFLTNHMRGLVGTDYGRLLQLKIGLFLTMLCLAGVNRLRFLPRLTQGKEPESLQHGMQTLQQLRRNTALEIALGLAVIYVVGILGVTPPAGHIHGGQSSWRSAHRSPAIEGIGAVSKIR
jgi:copper resistance protein D